MTYIKRQKKLKRLIVNTLNSFTPAISKIIIDLLDLNHMVYGYMIYLLMATWFIILFIH